MKRTLLALIGVFALLTAGMVFAQSDTQQYGSPDPSAATAPENPSQSATPPSTTDSSMSNPSATPSQPESQSADPATSNGGKLPATASNQPLVLLIGISALGGTLALRLYRLRRAH